MIAPGTAAALFVGAWNLVNVTQLQGNKNVTDPLFGDHPAGVINYAPNGYMSVCLQSTDSLSQNLGSGNPTLSLLVIAYTGPFTINKTYPMPDKRHGQVLHGPLISTNLPGFVGATFPREFTFSEDGKYLTLSAVAAGTQQNLLWHKLPQHNP